MQPTICVCSGHALWDFKSGRFMLAKNWGCQCSPLFAFVPAMHCGTSKVGVLCWRKTGVANAAHYLRLFRPCTVGLQKWAFYAGEKLGLPMQLTICVCSGHALWDFKSGRFMLAKNWGCQCSSLFAFVPAMHCGTSKVGVLCWRKTGVANAAHYLRLFRPCTVGLQKWAFYA